MSVRSKQGVRVESVSDAVQRAGNIAGVLRVATAVTSSLNLERSFFPRRGNPRVIFQVAKG